jgi:hypothetical protein
MRVLATTSRAVTTATNKFDHGITLPAHCQTPGCTLHRFDPAAQIQLRVIESVRLLSAVKFRTGPRTSIHPPNEQTPRSREPGGLLSHHPIHTEVGGFVRLPGLSGPRFRAGCSAQRSSRASQ